MHKLYSLQNGTDIRGVAYKDENNSKEITLSTEDVKIIASGFATWLTDKEKKENIKISLGMDSRITGEDFINASKEILTNLGIDVIDCGLATTPSMFMSTIIEDYNCDGAIMFTASHMPYIYNGMKMFTKSGCLEKTDLKDILDICVSKNFIESDRTGNITKKMLIDDYSRILVEKIRKGVNSTENFDRPFEGMRIIVDAGNGAGGFFAEKVLQKLGANTEGSQFLNPDGKFPNHIPNPENKEAMESISAATIDNKADLGIIFDTDVDRAAIVDSNGKSINKNALIAVISSIVLEEYPNSTIVTDSVTSNGLAEYIKNLGGIHHRFKRGYKNVINESIRLNESGIISPLAIETSGHAALKENYFLDDGAYLISKILIKSALLNREGKNITDLISNLKEAKESFEYRIKINEEDFKSYAEEIISDLRIFVDLDLSWKEANDNYEGIRVNCNSEEEKAWFLLRVSLHEPLLVLNIESDLRGGCKKVFDKLEIFLSKYNLDF
ncbi:phosphomannomutase/phosphoglucomutase [Peptostreptococcus canis]|uniref:Phosphomannomutase/phosphoglucomutase n=1 Tax=Peptostreptococcus canis TaxID=1159213 RepID=A0ABR6TKR8_9FIRM|nr:phosphomannomutase/phosphoglucomutase [Peptostreptococcus canis]MBC2575784.1 phosphomannomutase/phosphoglucomutase [Peptostreptococcus canis]MBP1998101.1 phosphomannomutase [Peptostreptococcus canis]